MGLVARARQGLDDTRRTVSTALALGVAAVVMAAVALLVAMVRK